MGAVPVAVLGAPAVGDRAETAGDSTRELGVRGADAGVDHVGMHARAAGRVRVIAVQGQIPLIDPVEPPGRRILPDGDRHEAVLLDVAHARIAEHRARLARRHAGDEAVQHPAIDPVLRPAVTCGHVIRHPGYAGRACSEVARAHLAVLEHHDVAVRDRVLARDELRRLGRQGREGREEDRNSCQRSHEYTPPCCYASASLHPPLAHRQYV